MSDKIRVTIFLNGDYISGGKLLTLDSSITNIQELCNKAQTKLGSTEPLKRVFVESGAEVSDVEDILHDDKLYFSTESDFIPITEPSSIDSKSQDIAKKRFLQTIAITAVNQASQLYDSTSNYVKNRSPEFVKVTLEKVEEKVTAMGKPYVAQAVEYGTPAINWADEKIDVAYDKVRRRSLQFLQSDFAQTVNHVLQPIKQRIIEPQMISNEISAFYHAAVDQFQSLDKLGTGHVSFDDFITGLKTKLGSTWNDSLVEPSKKFYNQVQQEYSNTLQKVSDNIQHVKNSVQDGVKQVTDKTEEGKTQAIQAYQQTKANSVHIFNQAKQKLGTTWEQTIATHFKPTQQQIIDLFYTRVTQPAEAFYSSAWASFVALGGVDGRNITSAEFLAGLRVKLGTLWNDRLLAPAQHLYESFRLEYQQQAAAAQQQQQQQQQQPHLGMDDIENDLKEELSNKKDK